MARFYQRKFFKAGLPFIIFVVGASFGLTILTEIRYIVSDRKNQAGLTPEKKKEILNEFAIQQANPRPLKEVLNSRTFDTWKGDPMVKQALEDLINNPLKKREWNKDDPEYQKKLARLKELSQRKNYSLEDEYNSMRQKAISDWENKRIPRPYEEKDEEDD